MAEMNRTKKILPSEEWELVDCNLCNSQRYKAAYSYSGIKIVKCRDCGLLYRNPRLKEKLNREFDSIRLYGEYEEMEKSVSHARMNLFSNILSRLGVRISSDSRRLLDIGCGQGHFLNLSKASGWQVEGVELAKSACEYAKREFGINIINKSLEESNFDKDSFDAVTLWNVLDHLSDPLAALREARRILKPCGTLFIRVPNADFHIFIHKIFSMLIFFLKNKSLKDPSLIVNYGFSKKTIENILQKAGYRDIVIHNSPLSVGDPYKALPSIGEGCINFAKSCLNAGSNLVYFLSFHKACISSSIIAYAKK